MPINFSTCEHKCWCYFCHKEIVECQEYLRFDFHGYRQNERVNICFRCLIEIGKMMNNKTKIKIFEKLEKLTPKERKEKLKLIKFLGKGLK